MDIGKGFMRSFDTYKKNFVPLFLASLIVIIIAAVAMAILSPILRFILGWAGRFGWILISLLLYVAVAAIASPFAGGLVVLIQKNLHDQKGDFTEVFNHFTKALPVALVLAGASVLMFVLSIISSIPWLGYLLSVIFALISPALFIVFGRVLFDVVDKGTKPLEALKQSVGLFLADPIMSWLYGLAFGILGFIGPAIGLAIGSALGGIFWLLYVLLALILCIPFTAVTLPFGLLGLAIDYENSEDKEPAPLKLDKQVKQIAGLAIAGLFVIGLVCSIAGWGYGSWGFGGGFLGNSLADSFLSRGLGFNVDTHNNGSITIKGEGGSLTIGSGLPQGFPNDVPVYPGSKVEGNLATDTGSTVTLTTKDSADEVFAYYTQKLQGDNWSVDTLDMGSAKNISFEKPGRQGSVVITESDGETSILLTVAEEE